jgi:hypothetical protein
MNPYTHILDSYNGDNFSGSGMNAAAVLLLRVMRDQYQGDMPVGSNPYRWVLEQLAPYRPNELADKLASDWALRALV